MEVNINRLDIILISRKFHIVINNYIGAIKKTHKQLSAYQYFFSLYNLFYAVITINFHLLFYFLVTSPDESTSTSE
jgi:hypothetical protein